MAIKALLVLAVCGLAASTALANRQLLQAPAPAPGPACANTVAATARDAGLTTLLTAAMRANLSTTLSQPSLAYTVFAPTNEAFVKALPLLNLTSADQLLASPALLPILENHLLAYPLTGAELLKYGRADTQYEMQPLNITSMTVGGSAIVQVTSEGGVTANVVMANIRACQSIVHVIDEVLIPEL